MKTDVLELILKAENGFDETVKNAMSDAEEYVVGRRADQAAHTQRLELEWSLFEKAEYRKLESALQQEKQRLEAETESSMERLKDLQNRKLEMISDRLKEEVLSLHGDS